VAKLIVFFKVKEPSHTDMKPEQLVLASPNEDQEQDGELVDLKQVAEEGILFTSVPSDFLAMFFYSNLSTPFKRSSLQQPLSSHVNRI
jgi:hypothetical protein